MNVPEWIGRFARSSKDRKAADVRAEESLEVTAQLRDVAASLRRRSEQLDKAADEVERTLSNIKLPPKPTPQSVQ